MLQVICVSSRVSVWILLLILILLPGLQRTVAIPTTDPIVDHTVPESLFFPDFNLQQGSNLIDSEQLKQFYFGDVTTGRSHRQLFWGAVDPDRATNQDIRRAALGEMIDPVDGLVLVVEEIDRVERPIIGTTMCSTNLGSEAWAIVRDEEETNLVVQRTFLTHCLIEANPAGVNLMNPLAQTIVVRCSVPCTMFDTALVQSLRVELSKFWADPAQVLSFYDRLAALMPLTSAQAELGVFCFSSRHHRWLIHYLLGDYDELTRLVTGHSFSRRSSQQVGFGADLESEEVISSVSDRNFKLVLMPSF